MGQIKPNLDYQGVTRTGFGPLNGKIEKLLKEFGGDIFFWFLYAFSSSKRRSPDGKRELAIFRLISDVASRGKAGV